MQLIMVPALVTLAITILRLVGELQHWSKLFFNTSPGGGLAVIGISWLPFIFGPYFAVKLARMGKGPANLAKTLRFSVVGFLFVLGGGVLGAVQKLHFPGKTVVVLAAVLIGIGLQVIGWIAWPSLFKTLLAYAYAARIPVAILMYFALSGQWGTHYDAIAPNYNGPTALWPEFAFIGLLPQLIGWPLYTLVVGSSFGAIAATIARRDEPALQTAS